MNPQDPNFPQTLLRPPEAGDAQDPQAPHAKTHVTKLRTIPLQQEGEGPPPFLPGDTIKGRFVLQEEIGRGGMSIVYCAIDRRKTEARDPNPLVAIKILNAALARRPRAFIALQRETRKAQTLAHPNVATVFDFDRDGDRAFMSMELLRGRSLDAVLREKEGRGLGREAALPIVRGITEGLAYAHRKGIVHSDLKPANVFLVEDKTAKILDFGIARAMPDPDAPGPKDPFDAKPLFACTEAYATAEMLAGKDPHPADDVYALGLLVYHLAAGVHPFEHCSAREARQKGLKPLPLRMLTRREWRVLERSLSFDRESRPRNAGEFLTQFFGVTRPVKTLIVATAVLAAIAAYSSWRHYQETGPQIPFDQLPAQTQQEFKTHLADANRLWQFYGQEHNLLALQEAVEEYDSAYELHPGNRQAAAGLRKAATAGLEATKNQPQQQREWARALAQRSDYLARYEPIVAAGR